MAWATTKGFNFRFTLGYVTDGANEQMVSNNAGDGQYPTTDTIGGDSVTYGWDVVTVIRDRDSALDRRIAGLHFYNTGTAEATFRIDLPATGQYKIRLAVGDGTNAQNDYWCDVRDNGSVLFNVGGGTVDLAAAHFLDADGTDLTAAAWPGSNVQRTITMGSTILQVVIRSVAGVQQGLLAHVEVEQVIDGAQRKLVKTFVSLAGLVAPFLKSASGLYLRDSRIVAPKLSMAQHVHHL